MSIIIYSEEKEDWIVFQQQCTCRGKVDGQVESIQHGSKGVISKMYCIHNQGCKAMAPGCRCKIEYIWD